MIVFRFVVAVFVLLVVHGTSRGAVDRYGDPLPPGAIERIGTMRLSSPGSVQALAYSPDGKTLASVDFRGDLCLWEAATGRLLHTVVAHQGSIATVTFSPDGKCIATTGGYREHSREVEGDGIVRLWAATSLVELARMQGHKGEVDCLAFSPDGKLLATGGKDNTVRLWAVNTGTELARVGDSNGWVRSLVFSPDGQNLLVAAFGEDIRVRDLKSGDEVRRYQSQRANGSFQYLALLPNGKTLAAVSLKGGLHLWDTATGRETYSSPNEARPLLAVSPDGTWIAICPDRIGATKLEIWTEPFGKNERSVELEIKYPQAFAASPDGRSLAIGGDNGRIHVWDVTIGQRVLPTVDQSDTQNALLAPDGRLRVSWHADGVLRVWDTATNRLVCCRRGPKNECRPVAFSPDGSVLVVNCERDGVHLWDARTWQTIHRLGKQSSGNYLIGFSPDGRYLMTRQDEGAPNIHTHFWDVSTGRLARSRQEYSKQILPDGRTVTYSEWDNRQLIELRDFRTGKSSAGPFHLAFERHLVSPDGQQVAGVYDLAIRNDLLWVWRLSDGKAVRCFKPVTPPALFVFSPDGRYLVSSTHDGTVQLWELSSGKECARFSGHLMSVSAFDFSPDGRTLTTVSYDGTALVWDLSHLADPPPLAPPADPLAHAWVDLRSDHAPTARSAIFTLACHPDAVPFLAQRVHATPTPTTSHLADLLRDLDASRFADRQRASAKLAALDESARPTLERTLATDITPEARRRIRTVLDRIDDVVTDRELLRALRAVHALEVANTPEARRVLETLAAGDPNARLTRDAIATLARLNRRRRR